MIYTIAIDVYCKLERDERDLCYFDVNHVTSLACSSAENFAGAIFLFLTHLPTLLFALITTTFDGK